MSLPQDEKEAKKHWSNQDAPLGRPYNSKDPGLTQVDGPTDILAIVSTEAQGTPVPTYRQRTSQNLPDPVARSQELIRQFTQKKVSAEKFMKQCETAEDMILFLGLYGDMADDKKAQTFLKLSKLLWDKQKQVMAQNNIDRAREDKQLKNTLENTKRLQKLLDAGAIQAEVVEDKPKGATK